MPVPARPVATTRRVVSGHRRVVSRSRLGAVALVTACLSLVTPAAAAPCAPGTGHVPRAPRSEAAPPALPAATALATATATATAPSFGVGTGTPETLLRPGRTHPAPTPDDEALRRRLDALVRAPGGPPGAIAVLRDGGHTRVVRAGVADLDTGRRPDVDDHMRIASASKAFGGAVALSLVGLGDLGLDDTLRERLPRLPRAWGAVTLRQLLNHTSGLPDFSTDEEFLATLRADPLHRFDSRRLLDHVADRPLRFRPGSRYAYSNSDNIAVALMAEAVTRTPYERLLDELVYRPLGLRDTSLPQGNRMPEPFLHGYAVDTPDASAPPSAPEDVSEAFGMSGVWAAGGMVSTPADVTRFVRGYVRGALYGRDVVREQRRWVAGSSQPAGPGRNAAGLGVFRYTTRCGTVLGHTGNIPGYTQLMAATPDGRRSLAFSVTTQITRDLKPDLLRRLRAVQEDFVCALLRGGAGGSSVR